MNTRLQVEHPVTELTTGIDLVEWQLLAAAGERLPLAQDQIRQRGHAIEARLTAERADRGFQPVTGELSAVEPPRGLRFDSGVEAGSQISLYYDSLIAKLIAYGGDRQEALERLSDGLAELALLGLPTTQAFLRDAIRQPLFAEGHATTRFIEQAFPAGWRPDAEALRRLRAAACVSWAAPTVAEAKGEWTSPWRHRSAVRVTSATRPARVALHVADEYGEVDAELRVCRDGIVVELDGATVDFPRTDLGAPRGFVQRRQGPTVAITRDGLSLTTTIHPQIDLSRPDGTPDRSGNDIEAPLHGVVSMLYVTVGEEVERGLPVLQMEAMKLIHTLKAPVSGRITSIHCKQGETVPAGAVLVEISPEDEKEG
jgi:acetyl/propionyl-CoA carboxylase alpha subunit